MASHASLDAAAQERKARLAKLKSLKRKQPDSHQEAPEEATPSESQNSDSTPDVTQTYLSGRNYDPTTRGPKLGFESAPSLTSSTLTLEAQASALTRETKEAAAKQEKEDKPLDLFQLQPRKPNWDLKRDLEKKLVVLNQRTENAIARLVRERVLASAEKEKMVREKNGADGDGSAKGRGEDGEGKQDGEEVLGMKGEELLEVMHVREREDAEDERREREDEELT